MECKYHKIFYEIAMFNSINGKNMLYNVETKKFSNSKPCWHLIYNKNSVLKWIKNLLPKFVYMLKLYYRYEYTRPYMINRIWNLIQL